MKKIVSSVGLIAGGLITAAAPLVAFGQTYNNVGSAGSNAVNQLTNIVGNSQSLVGQSNNLLNIVIGVLIALAIIVFIVNVIRFVLNADDEEKRSNAKKYLLWSVIGIAVIIGIFGIATLLLNTFGISNNNLNSNQIPMVPTYQ